MHEIGALEAIEFNDLPVPDVHVVRGIPTLMDEEVAQFFGVKTGRLNEQVTRNLDKFGDDFAFVLTAQEWATLKSQTAVSGSPQHGGRRKPPRMFSEHGVVMAATVLRTQRAIAASRFIVTIFVEARRADGAAARGQNLPAVIRANPTVSLAVEARNALLSKLDAALGRVLNAIADPVAQTTVREEARAIAAEGLNAIKEHLRKAGAENERTLAEAHKLLKEAEALDADIRGRYIENQHRQLAYLAKQLRMVIEIQRFLDSGDVDGLMDVLRDLGNA